MDYSPLKFDYELVEGFPVREIFGSNGTNMNDGTTLFDSVDIVLDGVSLRVEVDVDTDALLVYCTNNNYRRNSSISIMEQYIGKRVGWCWVGRNQLNFADQLCLGFDGIEPDILLLGIASKIKLFTVSPVVRQ